MCAAPQRIAGSNTSRGCTSVFVSVPTDTSATISTSFFELSGRTRKCSRFSVARRERSSSATSCASLIRGRLFAVRCARRPSSSAASTVAAFAMPMPGMRANSAQGIARISESPVSRNRATIPCASSSTFSPRRPVRRRMASSSASLSALAPRSINRSRGSSPAGRSRRFISVLHRDARLSREHRDRVKRQPDDIRE